MAWLLAIVFAATTSAQDRSVGTEIESLLPATDTTATPAGTAEAPIAEGAPGTAPGFRRGTGEEARDVVLMIRTKDFRDLTTLRGDLTNAGSRANCTWPENGLHLEAIDAGVWKKLHSAFGVGKDLSDDIGFERTNVQAQGIDMLATDKKNYFQIRVAPDRQLAGVELSYRLPSSNPQDEPETLSMVPGKQSDDPEQHPLRVDNGGIGGHYSLSLPPHWEPEAIAIRSDDDKPVVHYEWPKNSLVLGRIEQFEGSIPRLFDVLKDPNFMGVAVKGLEQSQNMTVVLADFVRDFGNHGIKWVNANELRIRVPYNQEVPGSRIWFLFPLDQESADKTKNVFRDRLPQGDYDLANALRGSDNPYSIVEESDPPTLDSSGDPVWLQLPLVMDQKTGRPLHFERTYEVLNRKAMQERFPDEVRSLYLYEKDMSSQQFPFRILPVKGEAGVQTLLEQSMQGWKNPSR